MNYCHLFHSAHTSRHTWKPLVYKGHEHVWWSFVRQLSRGFCLCWSFAMWSLSSVLAFMDPFLFDEIQRSFPPSLRPDQFDRPQRGVGSALRRTTRGDADDRKAAAAEALLRGASVSVGRDYVLCRPSLSHLGRSVDDPACASKTTIHLGGMETLAWALLEKGVTQGLRITGARLLARVFEEWGDVCRVSYETLQRNFVFVQYASHSFARNALEALRRGNKISLAFRDMPEGLPQLSLTYDLSDWADDRPHQRRAGKGDGCFKCGSRDHWSRECPQSSRGGWANPLI